MVRDCAAESAKKKKSALVPEVQVFVTAVRGAYVTVRVSAYGHWTEMNITFLT
jgi:hypothetical protein